MHQVANQGLLDKVCINYSNYPLAVYFFDSNSKLNSIVDYFNLEHIQVIIDTQLICKYTKQCVNFEKFIRSKTDYLFNYAINNNHNIVIINNDDLYQLNYQFEQLTTAYYFKIIYFVDSYENLFINLKQYQDLFSTCHELHYIRVQHNSKFELVFSKYGANICYYKSTLDNRTLQLIKLSNARQSIIRRSYV